ncbi:RNA methyltransferase [Microlunatus lacustris]
MDLDEDAGSAPQGRPERPTDEPIAPVPASQGLVRSARRLLRRKERVAAGEFLAEGRQAVTEALRRPGVISNLLVAQSAVERHQDLLASAVAAGVPVGSVADAQLATLADTVTPQGVLAVCRTVDVSLQEALAGQPRLVVVCDQVRDPGNLGTVIRCADAFGADAVLVTRGSVDLWNAKTVRASTGSVFHLPVAVEVHLVDVVIRARELGLAVYGADGGGAATVDDLALTGQLTRPVLWVMGNEAWGLPPEHVDLVDALVALPMYGQAESLNLSTAAAVFLYATATAQRSAS